MGILLIVLGLVFAGLVADFVVENNLASAPAEPFVMFGGTFDRMSPAGVVLAGAILGVLAVVFVMLGLGLLRGSWGRRRALKQRVADLEQENAQVLSRERLAAEVKPREDEPPEGQPGNPHLE